MLTGDGMSKNFWAEVVNTSCYVINKCLIRSILQKTPYKLLNKRKPKLRYLKTFGYKCFELNNKKADIGKFDPKNAEGIFVVHSSNSKAYRIFNRRT